MHIDPLILSLHNEVTSWRQDFHAHPELLYDLPRTSSIVAQKLREFGCDEVIEGIGKSGVVALLHGKIKEGSKKARVIAFRADMDALPILEETNLPYQSLNSSKMHACGHDGHTAMLLGAAKYLSQKRDFAGTLVFIFQPAEEGGAGAKAMLDEGIMDRFGVDEVYALHNLPGLKAGCFSIRSGSVMAAADQFSILLEGRGTHAAMPHLGSDVILAGSHLVSALQSIASRVVDPMESIVVSICMFHAGSASNIIPQRAELSGTIRTFKPEIRNLAEKKLKEITRHISNSFDVIPIIEYERGYPPTINHAKETVELLSIARSSLGEDKIFEVPPMMGAEDFAYMLEERPGAYFLLGNGNSAGLHHPSYNFNDDIIPIGIHLWSEIAKSRTSAVL